MFLYRIIFSFQIVSFLIPNQVESSSDITLSATPSPFFDSSATATVSNTTIQVSMTATTAVTNMSVSQPPTPSTKISGASSSVAASTSPPPSEGEQEAVVLTIADMKIAEFVDKKGAFVDAVKRAVKSYCSAQACTETSRKRRATTADQVYIVSGYPKASLITPSDLLVAVFVSTGDSKFLSKNTLVSVIEEYQGNVSSALERKVTGVGRLHFEVATFSPTESSAISGKTKLMYVFFGAFCGALVVVALCICVACWYGRRNERENDVRPLTTSNLELVDK